MRLTVIGCSPAWPNPGMANSGYLVEGPGGRIMVDCGPGVLSRLREHDGGWPEVDAIVLTHLHLDHWGDVLAWLWGTLAGPGKGSRAPALWVPTGRREECLAIGLLLGDFGQLDTVLGLHQYPTDEPFELAGFELFARSVPHYSMPTCGLRISSGGATLAYSADTGPSDVLVELARDADLFLCEATLADGAVEGDVRGHLSAAEAVAAFEASGAKRLLLTHRPVELPRPGGIELAYEGMTLEL